MQKTKLFLQSRVFLEIIIITLISALAYLLFVPKFGYFNDDWYLMYAAGARGSSAFWDIFAVDRPFRALVMIPAYNLFGVNPLYYNLSAFLFRLLSGFFFLWILRILWPEKKRETLWMCLLFLLYPGFLSQPNAIDYLCHLVGLAAGMLSIGLTLQAVQAIGWKRKTLFYFGSILLGWFYLAQIEWYIGLEFFRFACVFILAFRMNETLWAMLIRFCKDALPVILIPAVFLVWRLFYFQSVRGATDVSLQLGEMPGGRLVFLIHSLATLLDDFVDVVFRAWWLPLKRLSTAMDTQGWIAGFGVALLVLLLAWMLTRANAVSESTQAISWKREAFWIGFGAIVFGLFPVILVGRSVDFKSFSRYTLIASIGAALLWPLALSFISNIRLRTTFFGILILLAALTHYTNGLVKARETERMNLFWWQVSWRIPQMEQATTLMVNYPNITAEEDYFVWGPANLIYYPASMNKDYPQPGIYSLLINDETIKKVLAEEKQDFSNRRSIRTYPNYRNILILTQPASTSCVQVISGSQPEYSSFEDSRIPQIGSHSESDHILTQESFHLPPQTPFRSEPEHTWCFYYEKAALARQSGDWKEVLRLAEEASSKGLHPQDQIEWIPFLQAYAVSNNLSRVHEIESELTDASVRQQACQILSGMSTLSGEVHSEINTLFCSN